MNKYILPLILLTSISSTYAKEKKVQHDAHEHGVAEMNIVWEKNELNIDLLSPAFNITGFEHQPSNHEQEELIEEIEKHLNSPNKLFAFKGGSCRAKDIDVDSPFGDHAEHEDHKEHDSHDEHDHDDHKKHDKHADHDDHKDHDKHTDHDDHKEHDKHADHDDHKEYDKHTDHKEHDKHAEHDDHKDHKHAEESSTHSEYSISYAFNCEDTKQALTIETAKLFKLLPQMEKIKVQWLSASSQSSSILTKESSTLTLK